MVSTPKSAAKHTMARRSFDFTLKETERCEFAALFLWQKDLPYKKTTPKCRLTSDNGLRTDDRVEVFDELVNVDTVCHSTLLNVFKM